MKISERANACKRNFLKGNAWVELNNRTVSVGNVVVSRAITAKPPLTA